MLGWKETSEELDQEDCTGRKRRVLMITLATFFVKVSLFTFSKQNWLIIYNISIYREMFEMLNSYYGEGKNLNNDCRRI